jgi:hypothetical protein
MAKHRIVGMGQRQFPVDVVRGQWRSGGHLISPFRGGIGLEKAFCRGLECIKRFRLRHGNADLPGGFCNQRRFPVGQCGAQLLAPIVVGPVTLISRETSLALVGDFPLALRDV